MFDEYYVHAFSSGPVFDNVSWLKTMEPRLLAILEYGLLSRRKLKELGLDKKLDIILGPPNWNDEDYISLTYVGKYLDYTYDENNDYYYFSYNCPSLIINKDVVGLLEQRDPPKRMLNEIQIKDKIDPKYILGLRIPFELQKIVDADELRTLKTELLRLDNLLSRYNIVLYDEKNMELVKKILIS